MELRDFLERGSLIEALGQEIRCLLEADIRERGRASLAVSGGSTPVDLFRYLASLDLPWKQVVITLVDERWVEPDELDSNENMVREYLLQDKAAAALFIGLKNGSTTAKEGEPECTARLAEVPRPFSALILGMGGDGHTASFFSEAEELGLAVAMDSGKSCQALTPPEAPHERMTLTLPTILESRRIFLHITGQDKKAVLGKALEPGPAEAMPIRFVLRQTITPLSVYWAG